MIAWDNYPGFRTRGCRCAYLTCISPFVRMANELCLHSQPCSTASRGAVGRLTRVRPLLCCRHVSVAKFMPQHNPKRSASCTTRCQSSTVQLEDIDPLTGAVLTPVKSKVPKYDRSQLVDQAHRAPPSTNYIDSVAAETM